MGCFTFKGCLALGIIILNIPIMLVGIACTGIGIWVTVNKDALVSQSGVDRSWIQKAANLLLIAGGATMLYSIIGILAAVKKNVNLLAVYVILLTILIGIQVSGLVFGFVFKDDLERKLDTEVIKQINTKYEGYTSNLFSAAMNKFQLENDCCGWHNSTDYNSVGSQWNRTLADGSMAVMPGTCCKSTATDILTCVKAPSESNSNKDKGCRDVIVDMLKSYQDVIIGFVACILIFQYLMILLGVLLMATTVNSSYHVKHHRNYY